MSICCESPSHSLAPTDLLSVTTIMSFLGFHIDSYRILFFVCLVYFILHTFGFISIVLYIDYYSFLYISFLSSSCFLYLFCCCLRQDLAM
jgi:hypothetical protein